MSSHALEVKEGNRFEFGENWSRFLQVLDEARIEEAVASLKQMLEVENLNGKKFIDVGSGSGLFSLAARKLGATVFSFDYDPKSVACTRELKKRFFPEDKNWFVDSGSVLDREFLKTLGRYDVVYSWGVLHHTGHMWEALENILPLVDTRGKLFIAIYNDQGGTSRRWKILKKLFNRYSLLRLPLKIYTLIRQWRLAFIRDTLRGNPFRTWNDYKSSRGMSAWHDVVDWIGGYPFEVAKPEEIFDFYKIHGFKLDKLKTCAGGEGCNEFVFSRN